MDNFDNYKTANVIIQRAGEEPSMEVAMKLRFRLADGRLAVSVGDETFDVYTGNKTGNVFIVRIDGNGNVDRFMESSEQISDRIDAEDVERLTKQALTSLRRRPGNWDRGDRARADREVPLGGCISARCRC